MGKATKEQNSEEPLVLRGELFWKWKALHTALAHCDAEIKARTPLIDQMLDQYPELKKLIGERTAYVQQRMTAMHEYSAVQAELETHFGFSMKNVSIDDVTGRVHRLENGTPPADPDSDKRPLTNGVHTKPRSSKPPVVAPTKKPKKR
jgi:hypothetical protein